MADALTRSTRGRPHLAQCPRCGYSLEGVVASWREACPLAGVCSECGLALGWREACNPDYTNAMRLFEHAQRRRVASFFFTLSLAHLPGRLWSRLRMEHWIAPGRLATFAVLAPLVPSVMGLALWATVTGIVYYLQLLHGSTWIFPWIDLALTPFRGASPFAIGIGLGFVAMLIVLMPVSFMLLPTSLRRARVRPVHLARLAAYSTVLVGWAFVADLVLMALGLAAYTLEIDVGPVSWNEFSGMMDGLAPAAGLLAAPFVLVVWWGLGSSRYLRLPHAWGVAIALTILSSLVVLVSCTVLGILWMRYAMSAG